MWNQALHPLVIAGRLPREIDRLDKTVFHVSLDGYADVLGPVFPFARNFLRGHREIVKEPSFCRLSLGKMVHNALHVPFPILEGAHHVRIVPDPKRGRIRRAIAPHLRTEHIVFRDVLKEKILHTGKNCIQLIRTASEKRFVHRSSVFGERESFLKINHKVMSPPVLHDGGKVAPVGGMKSRLTERFKHDLLIGRCIGVLGHRIVKVGVAFRMDTNRPLPSVGTNGHGCRHTTEFREDIVCFSDISGTEPLRWNAAKKPERR